MNRRTAITSIAAMALTGCAGETVLAKPVAAPTEAEIWSNPTAYGVMPIEYIRNEILRWTADAVIRRSELEAKGYSFGYLHGEINGYALALRLMGVADDLTVAWAHGIVASLGQPMSDRTDAHWSFYPGNDAWKELSSRST